MIDYALDNVIKTHCDFWKRSNTEAIVQEIPFEGWKRKPYPVKWGGVESPMEIKAGDIDINKFLGVDKPLPGTNRGYYMNCLVPSYPQSWMSGIIGSRISASDVSCTATGADVVDYDSFSVEKALDSDWYALLQECINRALSSAKDRIPVGQFHYRGIVDMLAAFLKEDFMCLEIYDNPDKLVNLAGKFTELYRQVAKIDIKKRGLWRGGQVISWGVYAPGEILSYQADASNLFSADMYENFFLPYDSSLLEEFEYSLIHTHYAGIHIIGSFLKIKGLDAIQISLDREAVNDWDINLVINACKEIQDSDKCILITGELSEAESEQIITGLRPEGLMVFHWLPS